MTKHEIKAYLHIIKGKLKQKWAVLTKNSMQFSEGKMEELYGRIQKRTGQSREAVDQAFAEFNSERLATGKPLTNLELIYLSEI